MTATGTTPAGSTPATTGALPKGRTAAHIREAFFVGVALTAALAGIQYVAFAGLRAPFVPYAMAEILRDVFPGPILAVGLESVIATIKSMFVMVSVLLYILAGGGIAALYALVRERLPRNGFVRGLIVGVLAFVVSLPPELARDWIPSDKVFGPLFLLVIYLLWGVALEQTIRAALARPDIPRDVEAPVMTRRDFLIQTAAGGAFVGVLAGVIGRLTEAGLFDGLRNLALPLPPAKYPDGFIPARGTWSEITPNERFYIVDIGVSSAPKLNIDTWRLRVDGLVDTPTEYTFTDLTQKFTPAPEFVGTLVSIVNPVGGDLIGTAVWKGIRLGDVLKAAGVKEPAKDIVLHCYDGYTESLPVSVALDPEAYLVYQMNGVPLPNEHGYPVRLYLPTHYGTKSAKWLTRLEVVDYDYKGYWQRQGWSDDARVKPMTIINAPFGDATVMIDPQFAEIGGVAYAGARGVSKVEYAILPDDPTKTPIVWQPATLKVPVAPYAWVLWRATFPAEKGKRYRIAARMFDGAGVVQDEKLTPAQPDGATGYHVKEILALAFEPTADPSKPVVAPTPGQTVPPPNP
jgi:DMSO/TMAO reductase YedYZ molybdopterin-dependent catalytic subunit